LTERLKEKKKEIMKDLKQKVKQHQIQKDGVYTEKRVLLISMLCVGILKRDVKIRMVKLKLYVMKNLSFLFMALFFLSWNQIWAQTPRASTRV
jgi:hypothetical protein